MNPFAKQGPPRPPSGAGAKASPVGMPPPAPPEEGKPGEGDAGKASHEECLFINSDQHCKDCEHYHPDDGSCDKVVGQMDPEDACIRYFEPMGEEKDEEAGETGQGAGMPPSGGEPEAE